MVTVIEHSRISPPPGTVGDKSLSLTFFDLPWIHFPPVHQLCFYEFPRCKSHFIQTTVPNLKHSLSITLQHFFPFAGNLIASTCTDSTTDRMPQIRHLEGDSVLFTVAESTLDLDDLTGDHPREAEKFYSLVPPLGGVTKVSDCVIVPLLAVQVTIFPNKGICIGFTNHHVACDGNARVNFVRAWASITRSGGDEQFLNSGSVPFYDRTTIKDPSCVEATYWRLIDSGAIPRQEFEPQHLVGPSNKVRATFVIGRAQIERVKQWILAQQPMSTSRVSSFTIVCAYVWSCLAKSRAWIGEEKCENELEQFICAADCRARLDPPIPATYFGNCGAPCFATAKRIHLQGSEGFVKAVEVIGEGIDERVNNKGGILDGAEMWIQKAFLSSLVKFGVAGSPKFNIYDTDFGWGKPKKCEMVSIDYTGSMSLNVSKESTEDLEIGLCLPPIQMTAFDAIFTDGLKDFI